MPFVKQKEIILASLVLFVIFMTTYFDHTNYTIMKIRSFSDMIEIERNTTQEHKDANPLDGCLHVYLDVGSNIGVQVRKLFQPYLFPDAPVLKIFDQYFGDSKIRNHSQVCSVGFEPNPIHYQLLQNISSSYKACGWRAIFYGVGVGPKNDTLRYARIQGPMEWGGYVVEKKDDGTAFENQKMVENVTVVRLASYILEVVRTRKLPDSSKTMPPQVVMKLDIEGKEYEVLPDLVLSGALAFVDRIFIEWHAYHQFVSKNETTIIQNLMDDLCRVSNDKKLLQRCNIEQMDDESYFDFKGKLPSCDS